MKSEKVKEIKKALEYNVLSEFMNRLPYADDFNKLKMVSFEDILTLINELESENEMLSDDLKFQQMTDKSYRYNMACENGKQYKEICELKDTNKQLKDRIALLEKDNELLRNTKVVYENVDYCAEELKKAEKRIAELEKKNEKLKQHKQELQGGQQDLVKTIKAQHERIAELEKENDEQYKRIMELEQDLVHADENVFYRECNVTLRENEIREQALKQFVERLKSKDCSIPMHKEFIMIQTDAIDETLKEFIDG